MTSTLHQYREAKQSWLKLRSQAKKELIARFHEVSAELLQIQKELLEDFGEKVSLSLKPKKGAARKAAAGAAVAAPVASIVAPKPAATKAVAPSPLDKKLSIARKKLAEAKAEGKPTKAIEDRIYEIEDDIRVAKS